MNYDCIATGIESITMKKETGEEIRLFWKEAERT